MSKQNGWEKGTTTDPHYQYRWSYEGQCRYEQKRDRKKKRRGAVIYAVTMTVAFLCCFAILGGVLASYEPPEYANTQGGSVADAAAEVIPSTVLITGSTPDGYSYGTGFFIRSDGYVATNYHVIEGQESIAVTLYGSLQTLPAMVVGYSVADDLAVLKIQGSGYPTVTIGDSKRLRVGDVAFAVGNPSGPGGAWSTTSGIISALDRTVSVTTHGMAVDLVMLQTDAALNSGNSGGPLCNADGEVIGIVTRKFNDNEGIALAIPMEGAKPLLDAIMEKGNTNGVRSTVSRSRPLLGISVANVRQGEKFTATVSSSYLPQQKSFVAACDGVAILSVDASIPASDGLKAGDVIYSVDGVACTTVEQLTEIMYEYEMGDTARILIYRGAERYTITVSFEEP